MIRACMCLIAVTDLRAYRPLVVYRYASLNLRHGLACLLALLNLFIGDKRNSCVTLSWFQYAEWNCFHTFTVSFIVKFLFRFLCVLKTRLSSDFCRRYIIGIGEGVVVFSGRSSIHREKCLAWLIHLKRVEGISPSFGWCSYKDRVIL